jgi:enoyl-CoA hydratase/carnithine racemase
MNLEHLKLAVESGVATVLINRPGKGNSLSPDVLREIAEVFENLSERQEVRVIILTGGEKIFSAGFDLDVLKTLEKDSNEEFIALFHRAYRSIRFCTQPVLAAIGGAAIAGGFDLAQMCDIRYASERAKFSQREMMLSVPPVLDPLWRIIGFGNALEWAFTAKMIDVYEAHRVGFVSSIFSEGTVLKEVDAIAREMASFDRMCLAETKIMGLKILNNNIDGSMKMHEWLFRTYVGSQDNKERIETILKSIGSRSKK